MKLSRSRLHSIIVESIENVMFNIRGVYHVSDSEFDSFELRDGRFRYYFFSSKPIYLSGANIIYRCNLSMHKPLIFTLADSWSYPLWRFLSTPDGELIPESEFTREKYDGYGGCPFEFWKEVYYSDDEYEVDEIPMLVKSLNLDYDGVIIKDIYEGDGMDIVDDYIVFDSSQVQISGKQRRLRR